MTEYRTLDQFSEEYFPEHSGDVDEFVNEILIEYALDDDFAALLSSLRVIARVKRLSSMPEEIGMTRQRLH